MSEYHILGEPYSVKVEITSPVSDEDIHDYVLEATARYVLNDSSASLISKVRSNLNVDRFSYSDDNISVSVLILDKTQSANLIEGLIAPSTPLSILNMPILGYIFIDVFAKNNVYGPEQIFFRKVPVLKTPNNNIT